jgi:hypothetical protein
MMATTTDDGVFESTVPPDGMRYEGQAGCGCGVTGTHPFTPPP